MILLKEGKFYAIVKHIGVNDKLKNISGVDSLIKNNFKWADKCKSHGMTKL